MVVVEEPRKPTLDSIIGKWSKGNNRLEGLQRLAKQLMEIDSRFDFRQSPRGWCYTLENQRLINKDEFDRCENAVNECRSLAYLPIDFCGEDPSRVWDNVEEPTKGGVLNLFRLYAKASLNVSQYFIPDWWEGEKYYLQMFVEKIDLKSLFDPICKKYHVPIANAGGWSDLNVRAQMAERFKAAEDRGQKPVLLYCRDFDPWGHIIGDNLRKNLKDIEVATGYDPSNLIIDHFGLKYEFIKQNKLIWIDNLITGSGRDMSKSYYCYNCKIQHPEGILKCRKCLKKLYVQPQFVRDYIAKYGAKKCEANALVVIPTQARKLAENAILKYLGHDCLSRFAAKRDEARDLFELFKQAHPKLFNPLELQASLYTNYDNDGEEDEEQE